MMFKSKEIKQESRVEISSNVLLSVCVFAWFTWRELSVEFSNVNVTMQSGVQIAKDPPWMFVKTYSSLQVEG